MNRVTPEAIIDALQTAGVAHAFGLPGTQNIDVFEALRKSSIRTVVASHELGASFMANGYFRASGKVALLATIPGPGFTYAVTGLAEARLDSAALVYLTVAPARAPGRAFQLQAIDQAAMAQPVVKAVVAVGPASDRAALTRRAVALALGGEPGPVMLQIDGAQVGADGSADDSPPVASDHEDSASEIARILADSRRVVLLAGQGAAGAAAAVAELAERIGAAVVTTTSGRGVVSEDHRLSLGFEMAGTRCGPLNDLIAASDLVLAIGCKFSHNSSRGFELLIPAEKLVHVDASAEVIGANYPVRIGVVAAAEDFLPRLLERVDAAAGWTEAELRGWRDRGREDSWPDEPEPRFAGSRSAAEVLGALRAALSRDAVLVTDSGRHQMLVRRWFRVLTPRGLLVPTNLQSMGFAIPAAIGAKLARPDRPVVAVVGDGGLLMSGLELLTAVKARIQLPVIVFNDGAYGLIKRSQLAAYGTAPGSELENPDLGALAGALGINYARVGANLESELAGALALPGVTLIEVPAREAAALQIVRAKGLARRFLGPRIRRLLRRGNGS